MTTLATVPISVDDEGVATIEGTNIRVTDIVRLKLATGMSPEALQAAIPTLSIGEVYAAMAFYYAHENAFNVELEQQAIELDTNILVHYICEDALSKWIEAHYVLTGPLVVPLISMITVGEIRSLTLQFNWGTTKKRHLDSLLNSSLILPLDFPGLIEAYAEIDHFSRNQGRPCGENDTWIAATARACAACLLTTDSDFDHLVPFYLRRDKIDPAAKL